MKAESPPQWANELAARSDQPRAVDLEIYEPNGAEALQPNLPDWMPIKPYRIKIRRSTKRGTMQSINPFDQIQIQDASRHARMMVDWVWDRARSEVNLNPTNYCTAMWNGIRCDGTHEVTWLQDHGYEVFHSARDAASA